VEEDPKLVIVTSAVNNEKTKAPFAVKTKDPAYMKFRH
jgi:hypothetical protein